MKHLITLLFSVLILTCSTSFGQTPGSLDLTFNGSGMKFLQPGTLHDVIYSMAVQPDEKIVFTGIARITATSGFTSDLIVGRLNSDGSLDTSFANSGYYNLPGMGGSAYGYNLKLQPDGKIVVCGAYSISASDVEFLALRLNTDGTPDTTFGGGNGYSILPVNTSGDYAYDLFILDNGKILLAGSSAKPGFTYRIGIIMRLDSIGAIDSTFGNSGIAAFQISPTSSETFKCLDVTPGGKIIAAGYSYQSNTEYFVMAAFDDNGVLETSFATGGHFFGSIGYGYDLVIDGNNVYAGGKISNSGGNDMAVLCFDTLGTLNTLWGVNGLIMADYNPIDICLGLTVQTDGKLLIGGTSGQGSLGDRDFFVSRYNTSGLIDVSFGNNGYMIHSGGSSFDDANCIILQADDKILLGGFAAGANNDMLVMRLTNELSTGINSVASNSNWKVYPVPTNGNELYLRGNNDSSRPISISVHDISGRVICEQFDQVSFGVEQVFVINLPEGLSTGTYVVRVISGKDTSNIPALLIEN